VFIEANDDALLRRYSETRRPHPLGKDHSVRESLHHERELMAPIRKTRGSWSSTRRNLTCTKLRNFITDDSKSPDRHTMLISVVSFGYKLRSASGRRPDLRREISAQSAFCAGVAKIHGTRRQRYAALFDLFRNRRILESAWKACWRT